MNHTKELVFRYFKHDIALTWQAEAPFQVYTYTAENVSLFQVGRLVVTVSKILQPYPLEDGVMQAFQAVRTNDLARLMEYTAGGGNIYVTDEQGSSLLTNAAMYSDVTILKHLLHLGADCNFTSHYALSSLKAAVHTNKAANVEELLKSGANVDSVTPNQPSPLMWAAYHQNTEIIQLLISYGADVNQVDLASTARSVLHWAISAENVNAATIHLLARNKVDINARNYGGETPLLAAVRQKKIRVAETLLDYSPDVDLADFYGKTVIWWAKHYKLRDFERLIRRYSPTN